MKDVIVVGGGVIGTSIAWSLAKRGLGVEVVESGRIGRGASWAAAGVLSPEWSGTDPAPLTALANASIAMWPDWVKELEERSGVGLNYHRNGLLNIWVDPDADGLPHEVATEPPPLPASAGDRLSPADVRELEPTITGPILGGLFSKGDATVDNPRLTPALARVGRELGVSFRSGTPVVGFQSRGGRCIGVRLADGTSLGAGAVVLAAGAWSGPLSESLGFRLPVEPWRGQMLTFDMFDMARPIRQVVFCGEFVMIPRNHGPLIVGTTLEKVGFDSRVTLGGLSEILARASFLVPELRDLPLARSWAGLRPGTPDSLPLMGPIPGWEGLYAACGHGRKGIILAPVTGEWTADLVQSGRPDARFDAFFPGRAC